MRFLTRVFVSIGFGSVLAACCTEQSDLVREIAAEKAALALSLSGPLIESREAFAQGLKVSALADFLLVAERVAQPCAQGGSSNAALKLSWDARSLQLEGVRAVLIQSGSRKVWMQGVALGNDTTGPWLPPGSRVQFESLDEKNVLGWVEVLPVECGGTQ